LFKASLILTLWGHPNWGQQKLRRAHTRLNPQGESHKNGWTTDQSWSRKKEKKAKAFGILTKPGTEKAEHAFSGQP